MLSDEARELLGRYLRQRRELGESELVLDKLTAAALNDLLTAPAQPAAPTIPARASRAVAAPAASPSAPTRAAEPGALVQLGSLDALREQALGCVRCGLSASRRSVVFGEGSPAADVMVVGEAPGADEDASGRPFVGRAGKLLTLLLAAVGFGRDDVYICNVLKCRPPGNRNPQPEEVEACSGYLQQQVEMVAPKVILACGTYAAQTLLATSSPISRLRGEPQTYRGIPLVPTYHPAALLRNSSWVRPTWDDLQQLRRILDAR